MSSITQLQAHALASAGARQQIQSKDVDADTAHSFKYKTEMMESQQTTNSLDANTKQKIQSLFKENRLLTQQRDFFKRGMNLYKEAMYHYKKKYLEILSVIHHTECNPKDPLPIHNAHDSLPLLPSPNITPQPITITETNDDIINDMDIDINMEHNEAMIELQNEAPLEQEASHSTDTLMNDETNAEENNHNGTMDDDEIGTEFEDCYTFSVECHYKDCKQHFDEFTSFRDHLRSHYGRLLVCDLGCDKESKNWGNFISHIATHTKQKPFRCIKCRFGCSTKGQMKGHWKRKHRKKKIKHTVNGKKRRHKSGNECDSESDEDDDLQASEDYNVRKRSLVSSAPVILCTRLTAKQMTIYNKFKRRYKNIITFTSKWNVNVTHLVTRATLKEDGVLKDRTMKYFQSVVAGCWILCFDWIEQCVLNNKWCEESKHELMGDTQGACGCKISRIARINKNDTGLFSNVVVIMASEFKYTAKLNQDLRSIFRIGGGQIIKMSEVSKWESSMDDKDKKKLVFVYDQSENDMTQKQLHFCDKYDVLPITLLQVFDTISSYKPISH